MLTILPALCVFKARVDLAGLSQQLEALKAHMHLPMTLIFQLGMVVPFSICILMKFGFHDLSLSLFSLSLHSPLVLKRAGI